ncbi:MAG: chromosome segregation protein [Verrucomicrobiota bacterium]|jgi:hypothetical protein
MAIVQPQLALEFDQGIRSLAHLEPAPSSREPVVWVERLEVHKDTPNGDATRLRRIELRKGLNILWATSSGEKPGRLGGHGAGKTTFCRLLRFVIGDAKPGKKQFREDFREKFPNGWVLADVWLNGKRWLVGRYLGEQGHNHWAVEGGTLLDPIPDPLPRGGFKEYEAALDEAVLGTMTHRNLSGTGKRLTWSLMLPWLSRDQEAHYASLIEWRAKESDSDSDGLSAADRENLMRLVLKLVDPEEQMRLREREQAAQEHERLTREKPQREYHLKQAKAALADLFKGPISHSGDLIFESAITAQASELRRQADDSLLGLQDDEAMKELVAEEAARKLELDFIQSRIDELEDDIAKQQGTVAVTSKNANDAKHLVATTRFLPFKGFCSTPIHIARLENCPCITKRPDDDDVQKVTKEIVASVVPEKERLAKLQEHLAAYQEDEKIRAAVHSAAKAATEARRKELNALYQQLSAPRNRAADLEAAYRAYIAADQNLKDLTDKLDILNDTKSTLDKSIDAFSKRHRDDLNAFGDLYNAIVQAMLGNEVTGRIDFAGGKTLEPKLDFHGSFDSAALSLTKLLAFDLAALALSQFKGIGHHPRFLLHDSPRESDLAAPIYSSLFLAAQALEEACGENIGFQYIVTTTEPPPDKVNQNPWMLDPVLDATVAELRFLGVDLG